MAHQHILGYLLPSIDKMGVVKFKNGSHDLENAHFWGVCHRRVNTWYGLPVYKIWSYSRDMKEDPKRKNRGDLGDWGHKKSSAMSPFDTVHTISCSPFIQSVSLLYHFRAIVSYFWKVANLSIPTFILCLHWNFIKIFKIGKLDDDCLHNAKFICLDRTPAYDGQMDRWTDGHMAIAYTV